MTACAPSRTAADTAQVMPRSLNEPVGFAPSIFSHTSTPAFSESRSARIRGVEPSSSETTGSSGANGRRSRYRSMIPGMVVEEDVRGARAGSALWGELEDDLAGRAAAVDQLERVGGPLEREPGPDDRAHGTAGDQPVDRAADLDVQLGLGQHVGPPTRPDHLGVVEQQ